MTSHPHPRQQDLTARARIRNAALELYASRGEDKVSMRTVAGEVGVTIGLIQHHFGTKEGLGEAVDDLVVSHFVDALAAVDESGPATRVIQARNDAVRRMLRDNPPLVRYLNRALIEPTERGARLLRAIVDLTARELEGLRRSGHVSSTGSDKVQVVRMLMRQIGELLLDPVVDAVWERLDGDPQSRPTTRIMVTAAEATPASDAADGPTTDTARK